jgi:hypothetical protein
MNNPITKLKRLIHRFRDAITGRYVTEEYAEQHPDTTVKETRLTDREITGWHQTPVYYTDAEGNRRIVGPDHSDAT